MPARSLYLASFEARVIQAYRVAKKSPRTISKLRSVFEELKRSISPNARRPARVADLTTDGVVRWMAKECPARCANTVIGLLGYVRAIASYAAEEGLLDRAPNWKRIRPRRSRTTRVRHHPAHQIAGLLDHLEARARVDGRKARRIYTLAGLVAYTGLRRDESLFLRRQDLHVSGGWLDVEPHYRRDLKTEGSAQPVPIPPELVPIIEAWLEELGPRGEWVFPAARGTGPWWGGSPGYRPLDQLSAAGREVGIEGLTFLSLRASWATHAESRWGLTGPEIQRILRHSSEETSLRHYREADLANLRGIGARVSYRAAEG